ncbi:MAG: penicillin-binding protein [Bacilli bacterium]|nr:penicillin-binding protein [Bacilli bacterium]
MAKQTTKKMWKIPMLTYFIVIICFLVLYIQFAYLSLSPVVYGINIDDFAASRNTVKTTIKANRGTIYDSTGNILALNVSSYTVIAYLEKSSVYMQDDYVKDIEATANALSPLLNMSVEDLTKLLSEDKYQVELGPGGRGITELKKEEIEALNLSGIDFEETKKRYYPNGDFASYVIGYAKDKEVTTYDENEEQITSTEIVGELGIESKYNDLLKGTDGYLEYQQDKYGYKIANTKEISIEAENGYNIYLTLDANIQRFVETEIKNSQDTFNPEWLTINVMDAKTGDILASSSTPSFDPNVRNLTSYENPLVSLAYEPGSTMKIYTYMCALENNVYDGNETFMSGNYQVGNDTVNDWNLYGWGEISFDKGFEYSSNVGIANLIERHLTKKQLRECYKKYGFGETTDIELSREVTGAINFTYQIELIAAGFGQGITTTPIQNLQALTLLSNDGKMLTPHIVDKIVNSNTDEIYYESKTEATEQIVTSSTINKIKELMYNTVQGTDAGTTGYTYRIDNLDVIGKTGTAQIYDANTGTYQVGDNAYIYSFAGMFPYDDPEIIIYASMKKPTNGKSAGLYKAVKSIMESIAKYKNMSLETSDDTKLPIYEISSYINKNTTDIVSQLQTNNINVIQLGLGNKIIKQSILSGSKLISGEKIILLTNDNNILMPNVINWSRADITNLCNIIGLSCNINGYGYATSQDITPGTVINSDSTLNIVLTDKNIEQTSTQ